MKKKIEPPEPQKPRLKTYFLPTLPYPADVVVSNDEDGPLARYLGRRFPSLCKQDILDLFGQSSEFARGSTITFEEGVVLIRFYGRPNIVTVVHEAAHATFSILKFAQIKMDDLDEEVFAYLQSWLLFYICDLFDISHEASLSE